MFHVGKHIVLVFFFMHAAILGMKLDIKANNLVPLSIEDWWNGLVAKAPPIFNKIVDYLDIISYHQLGYTCRAYAKQLYARQYYKARIPFFRSIISEMDADIYIKTMLFFSENLKAKKFIFQNGNENCRAETMAIGYLLSFYRGLSQNNVWKKPKRLVSCYQKDKQEQIFTMYKRDIQSFKSLEYGFSAIVRLIMHQKGDVNFQDEHGNTLLHYAKNLAHIQFLLQHKDIDVNKKNAQGETPLHYGILHPSLEIDGSRIRGFSWRLAQKLLEDKKTDIYAKTNEGKTVVHYIADEDLHDKRPSGPYRATDIPLSLIWQKLKALLPESPPISVDMSLNSLPKLDFLSDLDNKGRPAIYYAVKSENEKAVKLLLDSYMKIIEAHSYKKTDIDFLPYIIDEDGRTLLHLAVSTLFTNADVCWFHMIDIIELLCDKIPHEIKYLRDKEGRNFVDYLYEKRSLERFLIAHKYIIPKDRQNILAELLAEYSYFHSLIPLFCRCAYFCSRNTKELLCLGAAWLSVLSFLLYKAK